MPYVNIDRYIRFCFCQNQYEVMQEKLNTDISTLRKGLASLHLDVTRYKDCVPVPDTLEHKDLQGILDKIDKLLKP